MLSRFSNLFGSSHAPHPKNKYTASGLLHYLNYLDKNPRVTDKNCDALIETLRGLCEVVVWGDQHAEDDDNAIIDAFLEHLSSILNAFFSYLNQRTAASIQVQLLQTLSILIENISSDIVIFYILSNNHINDIIVYKFDFSNEEVLAYYVSFLKTLSLKLNTTTIQFFFNAAAADFPLYTEAVKFFNHAEPMVVIAVRTLTLNVYRIPDPAVRAFVINSAAVPYLANLVHFITSQAAILEDAIAAAAAAGAAASAAGPRARTASLVDSLVDHLLYVHDIFELAIPELNAVLTARILDDLVSPLVASIVGASGSRTGLPLFMLTQLFHTFTWPPLINAIVARLFPHAAPDSSDPSSSPPTTDSPFRASLLAALTLNIGTNEAVLPALSFLYALLHNPVSSKACVFGAPGPSPLPSHGSLTLPPSDDDTFVSATSGQADTTTFFSDDGRDAAADVDDSPIEGDDDDDDADADDDADNAGNQARSRCASCASSVGDADGPGPGSPPPLDIELVVKLMVLLHHPTRARLNTIRLTVLLLEDLVGASLEALPQPRALFDLAYVLTVERLRSSFFEVPLNLFITMMEDEYVGIHARFRPDRVLSDTTLLLPISHTPLSGLALEKRLPCGDLELVARAMQMFLLLRKARAALLPMASARGLESLVWLDDPDVVVVGSTLALTGHSMFACTMVDESARPRYLVVQPALVAGRFVVVDPDNDDPEAGVARFVGALANLTVTEDAADSRVLHLQGQPTSKLLRSRKWSLTLAFDSMTHALSAKDALVRGSRDLVSQKLHAIAGLMGVSVQSLARE